MPSPEIAGIPIEFILFALTLLGVAIFHGKTFYVAITGVVTISIYKVIFTGFKAGPGLAFPAGFCTWVTNGSRWPICSVC